MNDTKVVGFDSVWALTSIARSTDLYGFVSEAFSIVGKYSEIEALERTIKPNKSLKDQTSASTKFPKNEISIYNTGYVESVTFKSLGNGLAQLDLSISDQASSVTGVVRKYILLDGEYIKNKIKMEIIFTQKGLTPPEPPAKGPATLAGVVIPGPTVSELGLWNSDEREAAEAAASAAAGTPTGGSTLVWPYTYRIWTGYSLTSYSQTPRGQIYSCSAVYQDTWTVQKEYLIKSSTPEQPGGLPG